MTVWTRAACNDAGKGERASLPLRIPQGHAGHSVCSVFRRLQPPFCHPQFINSAHALVPLSRRTLRVHSTVEADRFHKPLCVSTQKKGVRIRDHEALGLAPLSQLAPSLQNRVTLEAQIQPVMEQTGHQGPRLEGTCCTEEGTPPNPAPGLTRAASLSSSRPWLGSE